MMDQWAVVKGCPEYMVAYFIMWSAPQVMVSSIQSFIVLGSDEPKIKGPSHFLFH